MSCDYVVATHTLKSVQLTSMGNQQYVLSYQKLKKSQCALPANISCIDPNALELNFFWSSLHQCYHQDPYVVQDGPYMFPFKIYRSYFNFQTKLVIKVYFFYLNF